VPPFRAILTATSRARNGVHCANLERSRSSESMLYAGIRSSGWYGVYLAGYGDLGLRTHASAFDVTPFVSMQYARIHRDGFQEADATGFGLATRGQGMSRWQGGPGMRAGST
jgi:outer membrane autotransporter protein